MTLWSWLPPKKKLQNMLSSLPLLFFFSGRKISEIGMFACDEIQSFHNKNRENKRYDRMCLLIKSCVYRS